MNNPYGINIVERVREEDFKRIAALQLGHILVYIFDPNDAGQWADAERLKKDSPGVELHLRLPLPGGTTDSAADQAIGLIRQHSALASSWRFGNEPNLELKGWTPSAWQFWLVAFGQALMKRGAAKLAKVHVPAISPSGNYLPWLQASALAAKQGGYGGVDAHCYGSASGALRMLEQVHGSTNLPVLVTEFNFGAGNEVDLSQYAKEAQQFITEARTGVCVFAWRWSHPDTPIKTTVNVADTALEAAIMNRPKEGHVSNPLPANYTSPNHDGPRSTIRGLVLHATHGSASTLQAEYESTVRYFHNTAPEGDPNRAVSADAVIGPNRQRHFPCPKGTNTWHARLGDKRGVELTVPRPGDPIDEDIFDFAAQTVAEYWLEDKAAGHEWPLVWSTDRGLAEHWEIPTGKADGKIDIHMPFEGEHERFLALVKKYAGQGGDELTAEQKAKVLDHLNILWGYTNEATIKADPKASSNACHERIIAMKDVLGLN